MINAWPCWISLRWLGLPAQLHRGAVAPEHELGQHSWQRALPPASATVLLVLLQPFLRSRTSPPVKGLAYVAM